MPLLSAKAFKALRTYVCIGIMRYKGEVMVYVRHDTMYLSEERLAFYITGAKGNRGTQTSVVELWH